MKSDKSGSKKDSTPEYVAPKLSGSICLRAKKGKLLPLRYVGIDLVHVTTREKGHDLDWGSLPYDSKCMVHRALKAGDIELLK